MAQYIPDSMLLNNIFIPFIREPIKQVFNCEDDFKNLEVGSNGVTSVINLSKENEDGDMEPLFPYIDLRNFDSETKDWFWYDDRGFPYRIYRTNDEDWALKSFWDFGKYNDGTQYIIDPTNLSREDGGRKLGFYSNGNNNVKFYTGSPIILTIEGEIIQDRTVYGNSSADYNLTGLATEENKEFYYDSSTNRIYTNQNLNEFNAKQIKIYCYTVQQDVSVKCRLKANQGQDAFLTPTVDYYIIKLNGQFLRG